MTILASDSEASAGVAAMVCSAWGLVLLIVCIGVWRGCKLLHTESRANRNSGRTLLLLTALLPLFCCAAPPLSVRVLYGNFPVMQGAVDQVQQGMSADEVRSLLGTPHERRESEFGQLWHYWTDSFGTRVLYVDFGPDGRVQDKYWD